MNRVQSDCSAFDMPTPPFLDHMDTMLTSLDQYLMTCDHLTDYIFNVRYVAFRQNAGSLTGTGFPRC